LRLMEKISCISTSYCPLTTSLWNPAVLMYLYLLLLFSSLYLLSLLCCRPPRLARAA